MNYIKNQSLLFRAILYKQDGRNLYPLCYGKEIYKDLLKLISKEQKTNYSQQQEEQPTEPS